MQRTSVYFCLPSSESITSIPSTSKKAMCLRLSKSSHSMSLKAGSCKNTSTYSREIASSERQPGSRQRNSKGRSWRRTPSILASTSAAKKWQKSTESKCYNKSINYLKITRN